MKITTETEWTPTPDQLAQAFCDLDDCDQARFLAEVTRIAQTWAAPRALLQWHMISRRCQALSDEARGRIRNFLTEVAP